MTIHAHRSRLGRIAEGYEADFILWEAEDPAQIAYEFENVLPRTVFVAGRPVFSGSPPRSAGEPA